MRYADLPYLHRFYNEGTWSTMATQTHDLPDFDTLSVSLKVDKKDLKQKYQKRVDNWTSFFDKWSSLDDSEDKELELEKDGDWNLRVAQCSGRNQNVQKVKRRSDFQIQKYCSITYLGSLSITW